MKNNVSGDLLFGWFHGTLFFVWECLLFWRIADFPEQMINLLKGECILGEVYWTRTMLN